MEDKTKHGALLQIFLKKNNISIQEFADVLGRAKNTIYKWFTQERLEPELIAYIYVHFDIPIEKFISFNTQYKNDRISSNSLCFYQDYRGSEEKHKKFLENYFEKLIDKICHAENIIGIYDYFGKTSNETLQGEKEFHQYQHKYFSTLEKYVSDTSNNKKYIRIMALPLGGEKFLALDDCLHQAITSMFQETFEHIWRCMSYAPQFELYLTTAPVKSYSFGIIDKNFAISEYDRYDINGNPRPHMLFITKNKGGNSNKIYESYTQEIMEIVSEGKNSQPPTWSVNTEILTSLLEYIYYKAHVNYHKKLAILNECKEKVETLNKDNSFNGDFANLIEEKRILRKELSKAKKLFRNLEDKYNYIKK